MRTDWPKTTCCLESPLTWPLRTWLGVVRAESPQAPKSTHGNTLGHVWVTQEAEGQVTLKSLMQKQPEEPPRPELLCPSCVLGLHEHLALGSWVST